MNSLVLFFTILILSSDTDKKNIFSGHSSLLGSHTFAFVIGVLSFKDSRIETYPSEGRKDQELVSTLVKQGVPAENIIFLKDKEVSLKAIHESLNSLLKRSSHGDRFIFYYTGHGYAESNNVFLAPYDMDDDKPIETGFDPFQLATILLKTFKGSEVLFWGDFCNAGILGEVVERITKLNPAIRGAALTSAHRWAYSTKNWTYTTLLISLLQGKKSLDIDNNGLITFKEARQNILGAMWHLEDQLSGEWYSNNFNENQIWSKTASLMEEPQEFSLKNYPDIPRSTHSIAPPSMQIKREGRWIRIEVTDSYLGFYRIRFPKEIQDWEEWVSVKLLRISPPQKKRDLKGPFSLE